MRKNIQYSAICVVLTLCLICCKKNSDDTSQPTKTTIEGTCTLFENDAYGQTTGEVLYNIGGINFTDNETTQKYSLNWGLVVAKDGNGYATIDNPDLFTAQTLVTKETNQYFNITNVLVPNTITFQVKSDISPDELKNKMLGVKTIKITFKSEITYYLGVFSDLSIDKYYNDRALLKDFSKKAVIKLTNSAQQIDGETLNLTLTKQ